MNEKHIQTLSLMIMSLGFTFITFIYWAEPRSFAEVTTKSQVAIGTYQVDKAAFKRGLDRFRQDDLGAAREQFDLADPELRDAATQFYIAYSYYRQGWGRLTNDDELFGMGLTTINRVIALDPNYRATDETLGIRSPDELRKELEEGLKFTPSDLNPLRLTRERK